MAQKTQVIVPTAINMVTFVNDSILASRRNDAPMQVTLPTLRERAKLIVNGLGSLHVVVETPVVDPSTFTR